MAENTEKVENFTKAKGNELKTKKDKKNTVNTPSKTPRKSNRKKTGKSTTSKKTGRKKKAKKTDEEKKENIEDEGLEQENKDEIRPLKEPTEKSSHPTQRNINLDRKILPIIPTGQMKNGRNSKSPNMTEAPRRLSLPLIKEGNLVTSQGGNAEDNGRSYEGKTHDNGFMEDRTKNKNNLAWGSVTTAARIDNDNNNDESSDDNEEFRHMGKKAGKAAMFGKHLMDELNLRYLHAVLNDPDFNDKYKRFATPDLKTDEEDENDILQDLHDGVKTPTRSVSEVSVKGSDDDSTETELAGSNEEDDYDDDDDSASGELDAIPDDVKQMILEKEEEEENKVDEDLMNLGIWKQEDFVEQAQEADDEKSEDDWSIKTVEEEVVEENPNEFPVTPPPTPPPPPRNETPPYMKTLPIGDTPDIDISSSSESEASFIYSIYASQFDEYESDVFGSRLQENIFFLPSMYSDAGDSDMFYCVPRSANSQHPSSDYFRKSDGKNREKKKRDNDQADEAEKVKRCKTIKELNERFVQAAMTRYAVRDSAIVQYGGATKAFRLRMAKMGKDPKKQDNEINEKIERKIRKRLRRKKKTDELSKQNVEKLPNISKRAKVLRWITIHKKGEMNELNIVYENGWMGNEDLSRSMRLRQSIGEQGLTKRASLGLKSIEGDEDERVSEKGQGIKQQLEKEDTLLLERGNTRVENEQDGGRKKKKKLRKKRKRSQKDIKLEKSEGQSDESFVIVKHWELEKKKPPKDSDEVNQGDDDDDGIEDVSPQSDHSSDKKKQQRQQSDDTDSDISIIPPDSPMSPRKQQPRFPTPDTEPEPEPEEEEEKEEEEVAMTPVSDKRKEINDEAANSWKKLKPAIRLRQRRNAMNIQFSEITRILFSQLSLKTKEYSKLPPIRKKSRAYSKVNSYSNHTTPRANGSRQAKQRKITLTDSMKSQSNEN